MAPLIHWRATLAPGIAPTEIGDIELAESLASTMRRLVAENRALRQDKAEILREVADVIDAERIQEPQPIDSTRGYDTWRHGMARAVKVLRMRADDLVDA